MSVCTASRMCPKCNEPLANGRALETRIRRRSVIPNYAMTTLSVGRVRTFYGVSSRSLSLGGFLEMFEFALVNGLFVGFLARDLARVQQLLNRRVHEAHAAGGAALHGVLQLIHFALAN